MLAVDRCDLDDITMHTEIPAPKKKKILCIGSYNVIAPETAEKIE